MNWLGNWLLLCGYLLTSVIGSWFGIRWVHRHNVVMSRASHRRILDDLDDKTKQLDRLLARSTCCMVSDEDIDIEECDEEVSDDGSEIRVILT